MFRLPNFLFGLIICIIASNFAFADVMCHKDWMFGDIENQNQLIQKVKDDPTSNTNTYRYPSDAAVDIGRSHFDCKKGQSYNECSPAIYNYHADNEAMVNYCDKKITKPKLEPAPKKAETPAKKSEPKTQPTPKQNKPSSNDGIIVKGLYEQPSNVCKKVCGEASKCELHSFTGDSNTIYCPGKGNAWVDNNGNDYETGKPVKFNSKSDSASATPKKDQEKEPKTAQKTPPKKQEQVAKKAEPSEQDKCKDSGGLWEDKKCKHEGDPCTKVYGSGVGTYVKVGNDWKCKLTECKGAGYDIDASDNGYSCTIVGSKKEKKPENTKSEPAGEEAQNSSENNTQVEQVKSDAQKIIDAYNKRKEELKSK